MTRRNLAYATVKRAVMGLTNQTAVDFGPDGIRVNAVCPGYMVHEGNDALLRDDPEFQASHGRLSH
jgi:NAD(P)-dependent dehydrogenase (short-subunit alcohol dehydrogenase family)